MAKRGGGRLLWVSRNNHAFPAVAGGEILYKRAKFGVVDKGVYAVKEADPASLASSVVFAKMRWNTFYQFSRHKEPLTCTEVDTLLDTLRHRIMPPPSSDALPRINF